MTMIRRATGRIQEFTGSSDDGSVICQCCTRIVVSRVNLINGAECPFCHHNVNSSINDALMPDDDDIDNVAIPC